MSVNISKISNANFKGSCSNPEPEKSVAESGTQERSGALTAATDCLAAANKGGLGVSIPTMSNNCSPAAKQSEEYYKYNIINADEKILDGFKDAGRNGGREIICVDRKRDAKLQQMIDEVKEAVKDLPAMDEETGKYTGKEDYIFDYVKKLNKFVSGQKLPEGKEMLLGDIIGTEAACCRHLSLLFKILCDETGVKCDLVRGGLKNPMNYNSLIPHAWNIVEYDDDEFGGYTLFDCAQKINGLYLISLYKSEGMNERLSELYGADLS